MIFNPLSEDELFENNLFQPGEYPFDVISADEYVSKAGNEGIKLTLCVFDSLGKQHYIIDYLSSAGVFKIHQFCKAMDLLEDYKKGELNTILCLGKAGRLKVDVEKGKVKDDGSLYPDRMSVKKYLVKEMNGSSKQQQVVPSVDLFPDEDLPF